MNKRTFTLLQKLGSITILTWSICSIALFIIIPGRVSYIQWSILDDIPLLLTKIERINPYKFLLDAASALTGALIFTTACILVGLFITKKIRVEKNLSRSSDLARLALIATQFLLGHATFSLIFIALATWEKLSPIYVILTLLAGSFLGGWQIYSEGFENSMPKIKALDSNGKTILVLSIVGLLLTVFQTSARISYDATAIYFSDAKLTALTHGIGFFTRDSFVVSAFQSVIQYSALIQIFGDQAARMFSWVCGIAIIIFGLALSERVELSKHARIIFLSLIITSTAFVDLIGDGKVDLISTVPAIAAIYWMIAESESEARNKVIIFLIGFFTGVAGIARPFNFFLLGIFIIAFYLQQIVFRHGTYSSSYKGLGVTIFWIGIGAAGPIVFHLLANWVILDNPLAFLTSLSKINPQTGPWDYEPEKIFLTRLFYPFVVSYKNNPQSLGNISPLFIAFVPVLFLTNVRRRLFSSKAMVQIAISALITLVLWIFSFFTIVEIRYVLFLWIILFIPTADAISNILRGGDILLRIAGNITIVAMLVFIIIRSTFISLDTYSPIDKQGNSQCYDSRFCEYLKKINEVADSGDRILTFNSSRYYLRTDLFACSTKADEYQKLQGLLQVSPDAFWQEVYRQGYKYIAYENDYTTRHLQLKIIPSPENTPEWISLEPIFGEPGDLQIAYKIIISNPPTEPETTCRKNSSGVWEVTSATP